MAESTNDKLRECFTRRLSLLQTLLSLRDMHVGPLVWEKIMKDIPTTEKESVLYGHDIPPDYGWDIIAEANRRLLPAQLRRDGYSFVFLRYYEEQFTRQQAGLDHFFGPVEHPLSNPTNMAIIRNSLSPTPSQNRVRGLYPQKEWKDWVLKGRFALGIAGPNETFSILLQFCLIKWAIFRFRHTCPCAHCFYWDCRHDPGKFDCVHHDLFDECMPYLDRYSVSAKSLQERKMIIGTPIQHDNNTRTSKLLDHLLTQDYAWLERLWYSRMPSQQPVILRDEWKPPSTIALVGRDEDFLCSCRNSSPRPERWAWPIDKPKYCFDCYSAVLERHLNKSEQNAICNCSIL